MKSDLTFSEAYAALEKLVHEIEGDKVPIDQLAAKVKEVNELVKYCEVKLRSVEKEIDEAK